jgi:PAS domain S-box-containing protein
MIDFFRRLLQPAPAIIPPTLPLSVFRAIMDDCPTPFIAINPEGRIIEWNTAAEATFGWSRAEALGLPLASTIIPPEHRAAHLRGIETYQRTGHAPIVGQELTLSAITQGGHYLPVRLQVGVAMRTERRFFWAFIEPVVQAGGRGETWE